MKILAIDQGTTSTKAFTYDSDGHFERIFNAAVQQHFPQPGWVEHDPRELLSHIEAAINKAGRCDAIGIANQGETLLAWNAKTGEPIGPAIVWQDARTQAFCTSLKSDGAEALTKSKAGLPLDPYFSASKFRWILDHVPETMRLAAAGHLHLGTTDAFFIERLTGQFATDVSTASRTSLMNLQTLQWDDELCGLFGVPRECLPEIRPTTGPFGGGITASMVDQQAALFGHGCVNPGDMKITFGTGAFALALTGGHRAGDNKSGLLPTVAWGIGNGSAVYAVDGGVYNAGSAVNWARGIGLFQSYEEINTFSRAPAITRGLVFVPALSGLAAPHWDRNAAGLWLGLGLDTTRLDMMQALLEGVALRTAEVVEAIARHGPRARTVSIDGGLAQNPYFCQFLANAMNCRVVVSSEADLTALGVARMAMLGAGAKELPPLPGSGQTWPPEHPLPANLHSRFQIAVLRAKGWKSF